MDASFKVAYAIALNYKPYLNLLIHLARILPKHSTLSDSIRIRLGSVEFYGPLLCRARLWIKFFAPLRVLCNCHDLEDHNLRDMGDAMDNIEEAMLQLLENSSLLRDPAFRVFTLNRWPCLNEFYQSRIEKKKRDVFLADIEIERIFQCGDECEHLIDQLVVCNARGILKALYHNAHKFLTSCDGIYASEKWNASMIEETKHCVADNIYLAESHLGRVDYHWRRGLNFHMSTVSGLVMAMYGKLFFNPLPSYWTKEHTKACIAMTKKHYSSLIVEEKERKEKQDLARAKMLREKELKAEDKLVRNSLN
jgi:hypothetical protein